MRNKMYWRLVILIVLLIGVSVVILMWTTDNEGDVVYRPPISEEMEQVNRNIQEAIEKTKKPKVRPGNKNSRHGNHGDKVPLPTEKSFPRTRAEFEALPLEKQEALKHAAEAAYWKERGLDPPGYTYRQNQDRYHLVKHGEALFRVTWDNFGYHNDHQLSDTEWEEYKALEVIAVFGLPGPRQSEATPEVVALAKEWYDKLKEKTWGPLPDVSVSASGGVWNNISTQEGYNRINKLAMEKLDSLIPPSRSGDIDYAVVDRLLIELKAELEEK